MMPAMAALTAEDHAEETISTIGIGDAGVETEIETTTVLVTTGDGGIASATLITMVSGVFVVEILTAMSAGDVEIVKLCRQQCECSFERVAAPGGTPKPPQLFQIPSEK